MSKSTEIVLVKKLFSESEAMIYQARLSEAGIPSFISNANMNTIFPPVAGGVGIHVHNYNEDKALVIIAELDKLATEDNSVFTHHDATMEDIMYEKSIKEESYRNKSFWFWLVVALVALLLMRFLLKSMGLFPHMFDQI